MDDIPVALQWRLKVMGTLHRVTAAERRFAAAMQTNDVSMLAAADELEAATRDAESWLVANPCPDLKLGTHVSWMLNTCVEVALTAQRAASDRGARTAAVMERLRDLIVTIDYHAQTLDAW
jgi:hypothetical protein